MSRLLLRLSPIGFILVLVIVCIPTVNSAVIVYLDEAGSQYGYNNPAIQDPVSALAALAYPPRIEETGRLLTSAIPPGTRILDFRVEGDSPVVDFSREVLAGLDEAKLGNIFKQVTLTLYQFGLDKNVKLLAEGHPLYEYLPPAPVITPAPKKTLAAETQGQVITGSLSGRSITLSPGHGKFWNGSGWYTQRPVYCSPLSEEDYHTLEICQYLEKYLLADGMTVKMVRCTNKNYGNNPYTGDPWWKMAACYWLKNIGYPCSVYGSYSGCSLGDGESESSDDIRARPLASDYDGTDIYISLHTNGYAGDCYGSCPTGTITYYDCSSEHASWCTVSQNLANAVHDELINTIRNRIPISDWTNRGKADSNGAYGEIRIPDRAAILIELAFHDTCDRDAIYLRDNFFRSACCWAIYKGVCAYFGTNPTWDFYSDELVSHTIPSTMYPGETRQVSVTFRNRGVLWTEAKQIRLGAVDDSDPFTSQTRHYISGEVGPGDTYTFTFNLTAPMTPGTYRTDWRMLREGVTWFGATCAVDINVSGTPDTEPPSVPQNLNATSPNMTQIDLTWSASTDNVGVSGYKIYRNGSYLTSVTGTSYSNTGLSQYSTYTYTVSAYDGAGNESAQSNPSVATTWALIYQDGIPDMNGWTPDVVADGTTRGLTYDTSQNHGTYSGAGSAMTSPGSSGTNGCLSYKALGGQFTSGRLEGYFYDTSTNNSSRQGIWMRIYNGASYAGGIYLGTYSASPGSYGTYSAGVYTGSGWVWNGQIEPRSVGWRSFRIDVLPSGSGAIKFFIDGAEKASQDRFANLDNYGISRNNIGHNYNVNQQGWFDDLRFSVPVPKPPTIGTPSALSTSSIRWYFTDNSDCEWLYSLHDSSHVEKATAAKNSSYITETGLTANTLYTRHIHGKNGTVEGPASGSASCYTLSVPPSTSTVTCDRSVSVWYSTPGFNFTAVGGFGAGKVQYYRYAWDQSPTHSWTGSEPQWNSGTLAVTATTPGSWYLHLKGYNGADVENGTLDYGPFNYDNTPPTAPTVQDEGVYTPSTDEISANWSGAVDDLSGIAQYQYAIGSTEGGNDILDWTTTTATSFTQGGLTLSPGTVYYVSVKAQNGAGLWGPAGVSDGIEPVADTGTIQAAKALDNSGIKVALLNKAVTGQFDGFMYIQEPGDGYSGIRVADDSRPSGSWVSVAGVIGLQNGERVILTPTVKSGTSGIFPDPVMITNGRLGGAALNAYTPGIPGSTDLHNIGLLVTTTGRITHLDTNGMFIDDGSQCQYDPTYGGVYVDISTLSSMKKSTLSENQYVVVTGICGTTTLGGEVAPVVRVRGDSDVITFSP